MKAANICKTCAKYGEKRNHFSCPNDGLIHQEYVNFLCNKCKGGEMIFKDGVYFCPKCLTETNSLQCRICGSTKVTFSKFINLSVNTNLLKGEKYE